jgi:hypothetical protein
VKFLEPRQLDLTVACNVHQETDARVRSVLTAINGNDNKSRWPLAKANSFFLTN